jgi:hypothetical protein
LCMALCLAIGVGDVRSASKGGAGIHVPAGRVPRIQLLRRTREDEANAPAPVVSEAGERRIPPEHRQRLGRFTIDKRYWQPPGTWR